MELIPAAATLKPTPAAKRMIAEQLYVRGRHFIAAAILLHQHDGDENVVVHLLCQVFELVLKGLLLARDFDKYQPRLKGQYGHRLARLVCDTLAEFNLRPLQLRHTAELQDLEQWYATNMFRYGLMQPFLANPNPFSSEIILRRIALIRRLADRVFPRPKVT